MSHELVTKAQAKFEEVFEISKKVFSNHQLQKPILLFDLKGRAAGQHSFKNGYYIVRINRHLLVRDPDHVINNTVGHEIAHTITAQIVKYKHRPHGWEWENVMRKLGIAPKRCHSINTTGVAGTRQRTRFIYICPTCNEEVQATKKQHLGIQGNLKKNLFHKRKYYPGCQPIQVTNYTKRTIKI